MRRLLVRVSLLLAVSGLALIPAEVLAVATLVKDINPGEGPLDDSAEPHGFISLGERTVFRAITALSGSELWATDGTASGTEMLADLAPGAGSSNFTFVVRMNGPTSTRAATWRASPTPGRFESSSSRQQRRRRRDAGKSACNALPRRSNPGNGASDPGKRTS